MGRLRTPWTSQPPAGTPIDWSNPLCRGITICISANNLRNNASTALTITRQAGFAAVPGVGGIGIVGNTTNAGATFTVPSAIRPTSEITILVAGDVPSTFNNTTVLAAISGLTTSAASIGVFQNAFTGGRGTVCSIRYVSFNGVSQVTSATGLPASGPFCIAHSFKKNVSHNAFRNGALLGTAAAGNFDIDWVDVGTTWALSYSASDKSSPKTTLHMMWNRALSDAELASVTTNPWQIFQPLARNVFSDVPGGAATYTLSPGGSTTLSGTAPNIRVRVQSPSGSVVFSGTAPVTYTPLSGTTYTLSVGGTVVLSGAVSNTYNRAFVPSGGVLLSGAAPNIRIKTYAPTGGVAFSGVVSYNKTRVFAPTGSVIFNGSAPLIDPAVVSLVTTWRTLTGMGT